jgi:peptidoglycan hydrolase-like protein with peptidoglycan-binding domain
MRLSLYASLVGLTVAILLPFGGALGQGTVPESALQGPAYSLTPARPHRAGDDVAGAYLGALQRILPLHGYPAGPATGKLDPATRRAILAYQRDAGLPQDVQDTGVLKATLDRITYGRPAPPPEPAAPEPPSAPAAAADPDTIHGVQEKLKAQGYDIDVSGTLDPATVNAIKAFQMTKGLARSGAIDDGLRAALGP